MKILFISQRVPYPPIRGDKIRSFNILRGLSKLHDVSVISFIRTIKEMADVETLKQYCVSVDVCMLSEWQSKLNACFGVFSSRPLTLSWYYSKQLRDMIQKKIRDEKFDLIFVVCSSMAQYVFNNDSMHKVIDLMDVDSEKWFQYAKRTYFPHSWVYSLEAKRLRRYETDINKVFNNCIVVTQEEKRIFSLFSLYPNKIHVISIGVDEEYFKPLAQEYIPNTIVFTGAMDYFPNIDAMIFFCKEIFPLIKEKLPNIILYIVGNSPTQEVQQLANNKDIIVTGYVEDTRPYIGKAAVCVVPVRVAQGIQNKILEAMVMGTPVVTTSFGFKGIEGSEKGKNIVVADDKNEFAEKVIEILQNRALRDYLSQNGKQLMEQRYGWDMQIDNLNNLIQTSIN
ncbi:TIGR03087 family PEP-CTERM/XrtA system glycosyltransferase [bacterium]|nr:TIGR03087 family PEP-CTERM/XrtA system glycosyltransferase [bacterium]